MSEINDGGQAFPWLGQKYIDIETREVIPPIGGKGMSLRDYAEIHLLSAALQWNKEVFGHPDEAVRWVKELATRWLAARVQGGGA